MTFKELKLKRVRHDITAKQIAEYCGCSYRWILGLERGHYTYPCAVQWREHYSAALNHFIDEKKKAAKR